MSPVAAIAPAASERARAVGAARRRVTLTWIAARPSGLQPAPRGPSPQLRRCGVLAFVLGIGCPSGRNVDELIELHRAGHYCVSCPLPAAIARRLRRALAAASARRTGRWPGASATVSPSPAFLWSGQHLQSRLHRHRCKLNTAEPPNMTRAHAGSRLRHMLPRARRRHLKRSRNKFMETQTDLGSTDRWCTRLTKGRSEVPVGVRPAT